MIQYFINSKRNQVVCVLNDKHTGRSFKGVAKCCPEDKFDATFGKRLAFLRAQEKEISYNLSLMADEYDAAIAESQELYKQAYNIKQRALRVINRGDSIVAELKNMLK